MFAVIYQGYIKPGREEEYQEVWNKIACYFVEHRGALGSCLHRAADGLWVAYSRWPDKATKEASWPKKSDLSKELPEEIQKAVLTLKECLDQERPMFEMYLDVVNDLLDFF
jgi:hypothetical protein